MLIRQSVETPCTPILLFIQEVHIYFDSMTALQHVRCASGQQMLASSLVCDYILFSIYSTVLHIILYKLYIGHL